MKEGRDCRGRRIGRPGEEGEEEWKGGHVRRGVQGMEEGKNKVSALVSEGIDYTLYGCLLYTYIPLC